MRKQSVKPSDFYCTQCGNKIPLFRKAKRLRQAGHLKMLYCVKCDRYVNHVEVKEYGKYTYQDFLLEFKLLNFDPDGYRYMDYKDFKRKLIKEKVIKG